MNLSKQIKHYRTKANLSQEDLAEKLYVSRQTISNWENEKSYPDIHNLLMLSVLFDVSLDELVKGDVDMMKEELQQANFKSWTSTLIFLMILFPVLIAPSMYLFGNLGLIFPGIIFILGLITAWKVEKLRKQNNLKTYKQILDFMAGKPVENAKPTSKDQIITIALPIVSAIVSFFIVYAMSSWLYA